MRGRRFVGGCAVARWRCGATSSRVCTAPGTAAPPSESAKLVETTADPAPAPRRRLRLATPPARRPRQPNDVRGPGHAGAPASGRLGPRPPSVVYDHPVHDSSSPARRSHLAAVEPRHVDRGRRASAAGDRPGRAGREQRRRGRGRGSVDAVQDVVPVRVRVRVRVRDRARLRVRVRVLGTDFQNFLRSS